MYILPCLCEDVPIRSHHYEGTLQDQRKEMYLLRTLSRGLSRAWVESKLSVIYDLLYINLKPLGKRKSMLHPNQTSKNPDIGNQGVT